LTVSVSGPGCCDAGLLEGRVETLFQQREPVRYEAEADAMFHQWVRNKEDEK